MSEFPRISTAIPKRRYQFGEYAVTLLGEIETPDPVAYQFIMAFVEEGHSQPALYVTCERARPNRTAEGRYLMRIINSALSEELMQSDALGRVDDFAAAALDAGRQILSLSDAEPFRLM